MPISALPSAGETVTVSIEVAKGSWTKRRPDGSIDFVSPFPCPYNYGSIVGTSGADGDPLDAVVLGPRLPYGVRARVLVHGWVDFIDAGTPDPKLVCGPGSFTNRDRSGVERFFRVYAGFKRVLYLMRRDPRGARTRSQGWSADKTW